MLDQALSLPSGVPVAIENNVNCSAMAEHRVGAARFHDDFVYLQSGFKVGLGVMLGGGVGQNQLLLPEVRRTVEELAWTVEITIGALGEHATIQGAVHTAITRALDRMG